MIKVSLSIIFFCLVAFNILAFSNDDLEESIKRGSTIYATNCSSCHMPEGGGIKGAFPPLAKSDYLMADKERSIKILLQGLNEKIVVNDEEYIMAMPKVDYLSDRQIADVLNFVRNSWGNKGKAVSTEEVKKLREEIKTAKK